MIAVQFTTAVSMPNYTFTYNQEIGHQGQSLVPHYPGGRSGVTIGPGYDMGHRSAQEIYTDLTNAGIDPETAYALIEASQKTGAEAAGWIAHHGGISITEEQQRVLYEQVLVPEYEERARAELVRFVAGNPSFTQADAEWDTLSEKQKEILFDYVYNTGGLSKFPELTAAVLTEDWEGASYHYERFSGDMPLAYRNEMFFREFLDPTFEPAGEDYPEEEVLSPVKMEDSIAAQIDDLYFEEDDPASTDDADDWYETYT